MGGEVLTDLSRRRSEARAEFTPLGSSGQLASSQAAQEADNRLTAVTCAMTATSAKGSSSVSIADVASL